MGFIVGLLIGVTVGVVASPELKALWKRLYSYIES